MKALKDWFFKFLNLFKDLVWTNPEIPACDLIKLKVQK